MIVSQIPSLDFFLPAGNDRRTDVDEPANRTSQKRAPRHDSTVNQLPTVPGKNLTKNANPRFPLLYLSLHCSTVR